MGTALYAKGVFINRCYDELNLSLPALIRDVHQEYVKAGAEILETNTFGANRKRLAGFGFGEKVRLINQAGVRIAREAARDQAFVAGAVGPLGIRLEPLGPTSFDEARAIFREQMEALVEAGVDLIVLETFRDMNEVREAILAAREAAGPDLAIIAQLSIEDDGTLRDGTSTADFTRKLNELPVDVIGLNCSSGPKVMLETIEKMAAYTTKPLSAMPNAGLADHVRRPQYLFVLARIHGAVRAAIPAGRSADRRRLLRNHGGAHQGNQGEARSLQHVNIRTRWWRMNRRRGPRQWKKFQSPKRAALGAKLAAGKFVAFVEILPPRGVDASKEIEGAKLCKAAGIDCINVPDGPRASARMSAQVTCQLIQQQAEIEAVMHFCCRDRNILSIQSELLGAYTVGVRNLICITGDPPRMGTYPDATAVFDVDAIGLTNIVNNLNHGLDLGGNPMGSQTALADGRGRESGRAEHGRRAAPLRMEGEGRRRIRRHAAGVRSRSDRSFLRANRQYGLPVIAGIWPLTSYRNAEFMVNELRVPVPEAYHGTHARGRKCGSGARGRHRDRAGNGGSGSAAWSRASS